jgi:hypothetical protein
MTMASDSIIDDVKVLNMTGIAKINDVKEINMDDGEITGVTTINGSAYPPPDNTSNWSTYNAVSNVNLSGNSISNVTNINGSAYPPPDNTSNWANFKAVANVDMSGNNILNAGDINADSVSTDVINATNGLFIDGLAKTAQTNILYFNPSTNEISSEAIPKQTLSLSPGTDDLTISDGNTVDIGTVSSIQALNLKTAEIVHLLGSDETTVSGVTFNQGDISCNTLFYQTLVPAPPDSEFIIVQGVPTNLTSFTTGDVYFDVSSQSLYGFQPPFPQEPLERALPIFLGSTFFAVDETSFNTAVLNATPGSTIQVNADITFTSAKIIANGIKLTSDNGSRIITFSSASSIITFSGDGVLVQGIAFNNPNTGGSATCLNFSSQTASNNYVVTSAFSTNEFAITTLNTQIQITDCSFLWTGSQDSHRYIALYKNIGITFVSRCTFQGNGTVPNTACIFSSSVMGSVFTNGVFVFKNNISSSIVQRLYINEFAFADGANMKYWLHDNTIQSSSGFFIFFNATPLRGIETIVAYNNIETIGGGATGSKGIIALDQNSGLSTLPARLVAPFVTLFNNTLPPLRSDYAGWTNSNELAYNTNRFSVIGNTPKLISPLLQDVIIGQQGPQGPQGVKGDTGDTGPPGPGATPAGLNTEVQFNNAGSFGANSSFTFDTTTSQLRVTDGLVSSVLSPDNIECETLTLYNPSNATTGNILYYNTSTNEVSYGVVPSGGTPAGSNTQVQFNNSGTFGADSTFTFNETTDTLTATNYQGQKAIYDVSNGYVGVNHILSEITCGKVGASSIPGIALTGSIAGISRIQHLNTNNTLAIQNNAGIVITTPAFSIATLPSATTTNVVYYNSTTGALTFGASPQGGFTAQTSRYFMNGTQNIPSAVNTEAGRTPTQLQFNTIGYNNITGLTYISGGTWRNDTSNNMTIQANANVWFQFAGNTAGTYGFESLMNIGTTQASDSQWFTIPNYGSTESINNINRLTFSILGTAILAPNQTITLSVRSTYGNNGAGPGILVLNTFGATQMNLLRLA